MVSRITEMTARGQYTIITIIIAMIGTPIGTAMVWGSDLYFDSKYATDQEIAEFKKQTDQKIEEIKQGLGKNTSAINDMSQGLKTMSIIVLDEQILNIERVLSEMSERRAEWSSSDRVYFLEKQNTLANLKARRAVLAD